MSFCLPAKFHMKYLQYIQFIWKSKKNFRLAQNEGFL